LSWQDGHEVRGVGLNLAHAGGHEQGKCHKTGTAHDYIDHACQNAACQQRRKVWRFQGICLLKWGPFHFSYRLAKRSTRKFDVDGIPTGWYVA
jgi:hypothetical protein